MDNSTIRTAIVTATGDFPGISFELKVAIGHNFENPTATAYIDQIYFMLTVTDFDPTVFRSSYSNGGLELIRLILRCQPSPKHMSVSLVRSFGYVSKSRKAC